MCNMVFASLLKYIMCQYEKQVTSTAHMARENIWTPRPLLRKVFSLLSTLALSEVKGTRKVALLNKHRRAQSVFTNASLGCNHCYVWAASPLNFWSCAVKQFLSLFFIEVSCSRSLIKSNGIDDRWGDLFFSSILYRRRFIFLVSEHWNKNRGTGIVLL